MWCARVHACMNGISFHPSYNTFNSAEKKVLVCAERKKNADRRVSVSE